MLTEQRRKQLDDIVQQMVSNKEPDKNIEAVVGDFKAKYGSEGRQERIAQYQKEATGFREEAKKKGSFWGTVKETVKGLPKATYQVGVETPAKFIASATEVPRTLATGKASQKEYKVPGLKPFKSYISEAENRAVDIIDGKKPLYTAASPFIEVPLAGIEIAMMGKGLFGDRVLTGNNKGNVSKGFISYLNDINKKAKLEKKASLVSKQQYKKGAISAFEKSGGPGGAKVSGVTRKITYQPSQKDIELAKSVENTINSKGNPVSNLQKINKQIKKISEEQVAPFLKSSPIDNKFTAIDLLEDIDRVTPSLSTKSDATLNRIFKSVKKLSKETVMNSTDDNYELWRARIELDNLLEREFPNLFQNPEKATAVKDAYLKIRRTINNFIVKRTPGATEGFASKLDELNNLYSVRFNLAEKSYKLMDSSAFQRYLEMHPMLRSIGQNIVRAGAVYGAYKIISPEK